MNEFPFEIDWKAALESQKKTSPFACFDGLQAKLDAVFPEQNSSY